MIEMKIKSGFTVIESLLAVSIAACIGTSIIKYKIDNIKESKENIFAYEINNLMSGIDQRLSVDGYDFNLWTETEWNNKTLKNLIQHQLQAVNSSCGTGRWHPVNNEQNLKLVNCNLMKKIIYPLNINVKINKDTEGFINKSIVDYNFKTKERFKKFFPEVRKSFLNAKSKVKEMKTGTLFFQYIDQDTNNQISSLECSRKNTKCIFRTTLDRQGGGEYLKIDGSNTMIGSKIKFIKAKGNAPLKCIKWTKNAIGDWTKSLDSDCGIGFYGETPVAVSTNTQNALFETIKLDRLCTVYYWDNFNVSPRLKKEPCGITKDGTELVQLIPNIHSKNGYIEKIYSNNAYLNMLNSDNIISKSINTKYLKVSKDALFTGEYVDFKGKELNINSKTLNINADNTIFEKDIKINGNIIGSPSSTLKMTGNTSLNNTKITNLVNNNIEILNSFKLKNVSTENVKCAIGEISRTKDGELLNCVNNRFIRSGNVPIGSVVLWSSQSIPFGWLEMNGQSTSRYPLLKSIVGNYVPDMRGMFARGWDHKIGRWGLSHNIDPNRRLKSYQADTDQHISGEFVSIDRGYGWKDNNGIIKTTSRWDTNIRGGGDDSWGTIVSIDNNRTTRVSNESRPKNIALIYIIKAL